MHKQVPSRAALFAAAVCAGFVQVPLAAVGVGAGGKLGAAAAIGVLFARRFALRSA